MARHGVDAPATLASTQPTPTPAPTTSDVASRARRGSSACAAPPAPAQDHLPAPPPLSGTAASQDGSERDIMGGCIFKLLCGGADRARGSAHGDGACDASPQAADAAPKPIAAEGRPSHRAASVSSLPPAAPKPVAAEGAPSPRAASVELECTDRNLILHTASALHSMRAEMNARIEARLAEERAAMAAEVEHALLRLCRKWRGSSGRASEGSARGPRAA